MPADYARIHDPNLTEHFVYRLYGRQGRLLYIGCSMNLELRLKEHRRWLGSKIARVEVEGPFNYQDGRRYERELIETDPGVHNIEWTDRYQRGVAHPNQLRKAKSATTERGAA